MRLVLLGLALLSMIILAASPSLSEAWPSQPVRVEKWPKTVLLKEQRPSHCWSLLDKISFERKSIHKNQLFVVGFYGAIFFSDRDKFDCIRLDLTWCGLGGTYIRQMRAVRALEDIPVRSDGGRVHDDVMGDGFVLFPTRERDAILSGRGGRNPPFVRYSSNHPPHPRNLPIHQMDQKALEPPRCLSREGWPPVNGYMAPTVPCLHPPRPDFPYRFVGVTCRSWGDFSLAHSESVQ